MLNEICTFKKIEKKEKSHKTSQTKKKEENKERDVTRNRVKWLIIRLFTQKFVGSTN